MSGDGQAYWQTTVYILRYTEIGRNVHTAI